MHVKATVIYHLTPVKINPTASVGEDVEKGKP